MANTPKQAETLLHSMERAAAGKGLYVNTHKTEYMCYDQTGDISTLDGTRLKLVDKFAYLGSSVASTEKDIDTRLTKAWTAINRLSIIWKSDLTDKMNLFDGLFTKTRDTRVVLLIASCRQQALVVIGQLHNQQTLTAHDFY